MKKLILLVGSITIISSSYAALSKNSVQLNALGNLWKTTKQISHPLQNQNDITIVYGGEDISRRPTLALHTAIA